MLLLKGHAGRVRSVAYAPDGMTLASSGNDWTVRLWDLATGCERELPRDHRQYVRAVAFSPDGKLLASGGGDQTVRLWDPATGRAGSILVGNEVSVRSVAFAPDGRSLVSTAVDREYMNYMRVSEAILWDLPSCKVRSTLTVRDNKLPSAVYAPDSRTIALGTAIDVVLLWPIERTPPRLEYDRARLFRYGPGEVRYDSRRGWLPPLPDAPAPIEHKNKSGCVAFAPDGRTLAAPAGRSVKLWDVAQCRLLRMLQSHERPVTALAFAPDGRTLASAGREGTIRLWDVATFRERACFDWKIGEVETVAFAPDGMTMAAGGEAGIVIWDVDDLLG